MRPGCTAPAPPRSWLNEGASRARARAGVAGSASPTSVPSGSHTASRPSAPVPVLSMAVSTASGGRHGEHRRQRRRVPFGGGDGPVLRHRAHERAQRDGERHHHQAGGGQHDEDDPATHRSAGGSAVVGRRRRASRPPRAPCAGSGARAPSRPACGAATTGGRRPSCRPRRRAAATPRPAARAGSPPRGSRRARWASRSNSSRVRSRARPSTVASRARAPTTRPPTTSRSSAPSAAVAAAQHRPDAGFELGRRVRLDHVVVGAPVEQRGRSRPRRRGRSRRSPARRRQPRSIRSTSAPSMSGRPRSSTTTSGRQSTAAVSAAAPVPSQRTTWPRPTRPRASDSRMGWSSSITSTEATAPP